MKALLIKTLDWINYKNFNIENSSDDGSKRCFLEVDLDCPEELHDLHSDYPLASRSKKKKIWSQNQLQIIEQNEFFLDSISRVKKKSNGDCQSKQKTKTRKSKNKMPNKQRYIWKINKKYKEEI